MPNDKRVPYIAWDHEYGDYSAILGRNDIDAVVEACEEFGYGLRELAELKRGPHEVVKVIRAPMLDHYRNLDDVPESEVDAAAEALRAPGCRVPGRMEKRDG